MKNKQYWMGILMAAIGGAFFIGQSSIWLYLSLIVVILGNSIAFSSSESKK